MQGRAAGGACRAAAGLRLRSRHARAARQLPMCRQAGGRRPLTSSRVTSSQCVLRSSGSTWPTAQRSRSVPLRRRTSSCTLSAQWRGRGWAAKKGRGFRGARSRARSRGRRWPRAPARPAAGSRAAHAWHARPALPCKARTQREQAQGEAAHHAGEADEQDAEHNVDGLHGGRQRLRQQAAAQRRVQRRCAAVPGTRRQPCHHSDEQVVQPVHGSVAAAQHGREGARAVWPDGRSGRRRAPPAAAILQAARRLGAA